MEIDQNLMVAEDGNSPVGSVVTQHLGGHVTLLHSISEYFAQTFKLLNIQGKLSDFRENTSQYLVCELVELFLQSVGSVECSEMEGNSSGK